MALFDDEDEQRDATDGSDGWGVNESADPPSGDGVDGNESTDALAAFATATVADDDFHGTLKRAVDHEAGVVIYAYNNGSAGGLSTVPVSETDLADDG